MRLLLAITVLSLAACGFHLRGAQPLPQVMTKIHIVVPVGSPLHYELESLLLAAGGEVVDVVEEATAVLRVQSVKTKSRPLSLDELGRAREYGLTLSVKYSLQSVEGKALTEGLSSSVERDFRFDPDNVLARGSEQKMVEQELYRVAAQQMVRRLRALISEGQLTDTAHPAQADEPLPAQ